MSDCYNFGSRAHISRLCPDPQRYSRCCVCRNVCVNVHSHKALCTNKDFVSKVIDPSTVFEPTSLLQIGFSGITAVSIVDGEFERAVSTTPVFVPNANLLVYKNDRNHLQISSVGVSNADIFTLGVMDQAGNVRASISVGKNTFEVNHRYKISDTGAVQFNISNDGRATLSKDLNVKVIAQEKFKLTIYKFGLKIAFEVHQNAAILLDPLAEKLDDIMVEPIV